MSPYEKVVPKQIKLGKGVSSAFKKHISTVLSISIDVEPNIQNNAAKHKR